MPQCFKFVQKVAFNIASEASYVYILSGQKLIKNAKNDPFWRVFCLQSNSVTRQVTLKRTKIGRKCQNWKIKNATFYGIFKHCVSALQNLQFNYAENVLVQILMRNNTQQPSVKIADNCWYWLLMSIAE